MNDLKNASLETQLIHAGHGFDPATNALASPIYQTSTFGFSTVEEMDNAWEKLGYVYTREGNPTTIALEKKLAALESGEAAMVAGSGIGAITSTLYGLLKKGDHLLCSKGLFCHSQRLMNLFIDKMCVDVSFADFANIEEVKENIRDNTSVMFIETPSNPKLSVVDVKKISEIAKANNCIFIVDSTFAPSPIQRVLSLGADIVVHSVTKYINGHGDTLGGAAVGSQEMISRVKYPSMPCFTGAAISPFNAWLIMRGLVTLDMRVRKHCENALKIAEFLESHPYVESVIYPALESHPQHELCKSQMNGLGGGIVSFWLKEEINGLPRRKADYKLCNNTSIITIATSLGEALTLIQVEDDDMVRLAVGLENADDIIADLKQAFDKI